MKRTAAIFLTVVLAALNINADADNPQPATPKEEKKESAKARQDAGIRKLSRRERKERIKNLPDQHRQFLEDVEPIILQTEIDAFLTLETDAQRDVYITDFWRRRDSAEGISNFAFRDLYYERLNEVKSMFKYVSSDRSRFYLLHGEPGEVLREHCDRLLQPLEIWIYPYIKGFGKPARILFYQPRMGTDYRLWMPIGDDAHDLGELVSQEAAASSVTPEGAVRSVFYEAASPYSRISKIQANCMNGDDILMAIENMRANKYDVPKLFEPPEIIAEDVGRILRSAVIATPNAPKLAAEFSVRYPARQGTRTDAEMTVLVPREQLRANDIGGTLTYSINVTGEILREEKMFENFRYRFDFPGDIKDEKLPVIIERFLRANEYKARLKVVDATSGAEVILENMITVPEITESPEQRQRKEAATAAVSALKDDIDSNETRLRIIPMPEDLLSGVQQVQTIAIGDNIRTVEFYLDGKKIAAKRQPPYTLDLDFGTMPQSRRVRAVALDAKGQIITGDEIVLNTGTDPFRVRIVSPRVAVNVKGKTRVEMSVRVPEGKQLGELSLYLNEAKVATLYAPPYVQTIDVPASEGVSYIRAVATLKDEPGQIEDLVMLNTPQFMEEVNVHLVELPTTVVVNGEHKTDLPESAFKVLDDGKPVKVAKFEYVKDLPLSLGIALDTSGSMLARIAEAQKTAGSFLEKVMKSGDRAFLVAFDSEAQLVQKWTPRVTDLNAGLAKVRAEEYTALYDAVVYSLYNFLGVRGQKALVLITDGKDTRSKFSFDQAMEYARRAAVPIYVISIAIRATEIDTRHKLGRLASETGGNVYYIEKAEDLTRIYEDIQNELRSQYVLGFYPPEGVKPGGKWREVSVQVSEGKAKTIRGYYP